MPDKSSISTSALIRLYPRNEHVLKMLENLSEVNELNDDFKMQFHNLDDTDEENLLPDDLSDEEVRPANAEDPLEYEISFEPLDNKPSKGLLQTKATQSAQTIHGKKLSFDYPALPINPVRSPIEYVRDYFDNNFFEEVARCTNLYYLRKTGKELKSTADEMVKLFSMHIIMGCIPYPRLNMYWRADTKLGLVCDKMARDRFHTLRNALHIVDNEKPLQKEKKNKLWKVQPMINPVKSTCEKLERVPGYYDVGIQMIPFTGQSKSQCKLLKKNSRPVGLKFLVLTTSEGLMLNFSICHRVKTTSSKISFGLGPCSIRDLINSVPSGSSVFYKKNCTSTSSVEVTNIRNKNANKGQGLIPGCSTKSIEHKADVVRLEKHSESELDVNTFEVVKCNQRIGGVNILNQQMEYYRTFIKTRKISLKVIFHFLDLVLVNSWRLYKNDYLANGFSEKNSLSLLDFRMIVADVLANSPLEKKSRSDAQNELLPLQTDRYRPANPPSDDKRFDGYDHFPISDELKAPRSCRYEHCSSRSKIRCEKCNVYLCLSRGKDCFKYYHIKK